MSIGSITGVNGSPPSNSSLAIKETNWESVVALSNPKSLFNVSFDTFGNVETKSSTSETSLIPADNPLWLVIRSKVFNILPIFLKNYPSNFKPTVICKLAERCVICKFYLIWIKCGKW